MMASDWNTLLVHCGVKPLLAAQWAPHFEIECAPHKFSKGVSEIDDFLGQVLHESALLSRLEENLSYRAERLMQVWPKRFPNLQATEGYTGNPVALANKVYGGRMGNDEPGDGWKYRGSGLIMVTGKDNFRALEHATGLPLLANPDLLRRPGPECLRVCVTWWEGNVPDSVLGDIVRVSRAVNGGTIGLEERIALTHAAQENLS